MNLENHILLWNHVFIQIIDVRYAVKIPGEKQPSYRLPSSAFLYIVRGEAEVHLDHSRHRVEKFHVLHGGKGARLQLDPASEFEYYLILYRAIPASSSHKEIIRLMESDNPFLDQYAFVPHYSLMLYEKVELLEREWRHGSGLEKTAASRGYELLPDESDSAISITLDREFPVLLPEGFRLCSGNEASDTAKAEGHMMAFNYAGTRGAEQMVQFYGGIREAPGYRPELDLAVLNGNGEVAAFCNIFTDEANRIGILEPVGTHPNYRNRGLGKAVIYEGLNRLRAKSMVKAYTGPYQPFYGAIGFKPEVEFGVWRKKMN